MSINRNSVGNIFMKTSDDENIYIYTWDEFVNQCMGW